MGSSASSLLRITRQAPPPRVAAEAISALPEARPPEVSASVPAIPTEIAPRPDALEALYSLLLSQGSPEYIRSDNGPEFAAKAMQGWLRRVGITPICIYPGSLLSGHRHAMPCRGSAWENGYNERFNGTLRREVLNAEWFTTTEQAQIVINHWLRQYNHIRPHQALNMRPPVPETVLEKKPIGGPETGS